MGYTTKEIDEMRIQDIQLMIETQEIFRKLDAKNIAAAISWGLTGKDPFRLR